MSTICKLDPTVRQRRAMRRNLLRNPPHKARPEVMAELALIHDNPRLTGAKKHELFMRGAKQLSEL